MLLLSNLWSCYLSACYIGIQLNVLKHSCGFIALVYLLSGFVGLKSTSASSSTPEHHQQQQEEPWNRSWRCGAVTGVRRQVEPSTLHYDPQSTVHPSPPRSTDGPSVARWTPATPHQGPSHARKLAASLKLKTKTWKLSCDNPSPPEKN